MSKVLKAVLAWCVLSGCGVPEPEPDTRSHLVLRKGQSLAETDKCGVDLPSCSNDQLCIAFALEGEKLQARCVNAAKVCTELLTCSNEGRCTVLLSYPSQVMCATGPGCTKDCDAPVSSP
ncbi:MAG: hypothetical protein ABW123_28580 [Cystobacter sp.]